MGGNEEEEEKERGGKNPIVLAEAKRAAIHQPLDHTTCHYEPDIRARRMKYALLQTIGRMSSSTTNEAKKKKSCWLASWHPHPYLSGAGRWLVF